MKKLLVLKCYQLLFSLALTISPMLHWQSDLQVEAHEDDLNAICFGDSASNIFYSGGDDGLCKVLPEPRLVTAVLNLTFDRLSADLHTVCG